MNRPTQWLHAVPGACVLALLIGLSTAAPASAQVTVTSATPNNGQQGTSSLNVRIAGGGFEKGAKATWYVSGTIDTGGVTVNSTAFVNSSQLVANISIAGNATLGSFDVAVKNTNGRTGVGSDAFTVNPEAVTSFVSITDATGSSFTVQGDGLDLSPSGASTYINYPESCATYPGTLQKTCILMSLLPNDWYLRLSQGGGPSGRNIRLTLIPIGNSPNESGLDGFYPASVATRCFDANNNWMSIPLTIPPGTSNNRCSLIISFSNNGTSYGLNMGPLYSGTGWSTVACTSGTGTTCNQWSIAPTPGNLLPNPSLANVTNLYTFGAGGKMTLIGTYECTFSIVLTRP